MKVLFMHSEDGDWVGMYIDKKLVMEGHSFRPEDIVNALGIEVQSAEATEKWFDKHGGHCAEHL